MKFVVDARGVRLDDSDIHEIASCLKRFLRELEDSLFTRQLYNEWIHTSRMYHTFSILSISAFTCLHADIYLHSSGTPRGMMKRDPKKVLISYVPPSICIILIFFLIYFIQEICTVDLFVFWDWSANIDEISNLDIRTVREPSKSFLLLPPLSQTAPYIFLLQPVPSRTVYNKNNNSWIYKVKFCEC